ncbi:MAG: hypothetical protein WC437_05515 [Patescibacteria group bacterium]
MLFTTKKGIEINIDEVKLVSISTINLDKRTVDRAIVVTKAGDVELFGGEVFEFQQFLAQEKLDK